MATVVGTTPPGMLNRGGVADEEKRHGIPTKEPPHTWGRLLLPPPVPVPRHSRLIDWCRMAAYLLLCVYLNVLVQVIVDARWFALVEANGGAIPPSLMDLGFEWLPRVPYHPIVGLTAPVLTGAMILVLYLKTGRFFNDLLRQALVISATNFLLRAGTLHLTLLPPSLADCMQGGALPAAVKAWPLWTRPLLVIGGQYATCTDAFFSGHAANLTVDLFFWFYWVVVRRPHTPSLAHRLLTFLVLFAYGFSLFLIIASRFHYTIDVFVGVWLSWTVCYVYYYLE